MIANRRTILVWLAAALALALVFGCLWLLRWGQLHGAAQPLEELLHRLSYLLIGVVLSLIGAFKYRLRQTDPIDRDEM